MKIIAWEERGSASTEGLALPDADRLALEAPEERWLAVDGAGSPLAHAALWRQGGRLPDGRSTGYLGHLAGSHAGALAAVIDHAARRLGGVDLAVAPIDGSTWFGYRLVVEGADSGPGFPGEPGADPVLREALAAAGFAIFEHYATVALEDLGNRTWSADLRSAVVARAGVTVRQIDRGRLDAELAWLHPLALAAFADNALFTPIDAARFVALYRPLLARLDPRFVLVAEGQGSEPLGLGLAYADPAAPDTLVMKTAAALPETRRFGLGIHLVRQIVGRAQAAGFRRVLFALMHEENLSYRWAVGHGRVVRRYALFARPPAGPA